MFGQELFLICGILQNMWGRNVLLYDIYFVNFRHKGLAVLRELIMK